jgi:hypothetical protein
MHSYMKISSSDNETGLAHKNIEIGGRVHVRQKWVLPSLSISSPSSPSSPAKIDRSDSLINETVSDYVVLLFFLCQLDHHSGAILRHSDTSFSSAS